MNGRILRRLTVAAVSALTTAQTYATVRRHAPGGSVRWARANYAGDTVTLLAGPAVVAGLAVGTVVADTLPWARRIALASLITGIGAVGAYDDLHGAAGIKGLRGHLRALGSGEVTSGTVKFAVIPAAGVSAAVLLGRGRSTVLLDGALVATTANLVNLLDLRPGRALKVVVVPCAAALGSAGGQLAAPTLGACAAALPEDLAGRAMLGDCGANALGAAVGCLVVSAVPTPWRVLALAAVSALTLASERVSFTAVIERHPVLSRIDAWGRSPARRHVDPRRQPGA